MTDTLTIRLICLYPPPGDYGGTPAAFGLQTRTGGLIAGSWRDDGALVFEFTVGLSRARDGLRFGGTAGIDVVQGRPREPFVYLSYGLAQVSGYAWITRLKLRLDDIPLALLDRALTGAVLEATVDGRRAATVRPEGGWQAVDEQS